MISRMNFKYETDYVGHLSNLHPQTRPRGQLMILEGISRQEFVSLEHLIK